MSVLPKGYEIPKTKTAYMTLEEGDNSFRILSPVVVGWKYWIEKDDKKTAVRVRTEEEVPANVKNQTDPRNRAKHFWMFAVLNREAGDVQILEITQRGIQDSLKGYEEIEAWGDLRGYDMIIARKNGKTPMDVKYDLFPKPKEELSKEVKKLVDEKLENIDLELVFEGESPFITPKG